MTKEENLLQNLPDWVHKKMNVPHIPGIRTSVPAWDTDGNFRSPPSRHRDRYHSRTSPKLGHLISKCRTVRGFSNHLSNAKHPWTWGNYVWDVTMCVWAGHWNFMATPLHVGMQPRVHRSDVASLIFALAIKTHLCCQAICNADRMAGKMSIYKIRSPKQDEGRLLR